MNYDASARSRVLNKLVQIRARHPALSWTEMADQITLLRGSFHTKYFRRLKDGRLGNRRVNDIVEWITAKFDSSFRESFKPHPAGTAHSSILMARAERNRWKRASPELQSAIRDILTDSPLVSFFSKQDTSVEFIPLSFLDGARFVRAKNLANVPNNSQYFISYNEWIFDFDGSRKRFQSICNAIPVTLEASNCLEFCEFMLSYLDGTLATIVHNTNDIDHEAFSSHSTKHVLDRRVYDLLEFPSIGTDDRDVITFCQFDAIVNRQYKRYRCDFNTNLSNSRASALCTVCNLADYLRPQEDEYRRADANILVSDGDFRDAIEFMKRSERGRSCANLIENANIRIQHAFGPLEACTYDRGSNTMLYISNPDHSYSVFRQAGWIVYVLYFASAHRSGFVIPPLTDGVVEYASRVHAVTLDALMFLCRFISEVSGIVSNAEEVASFLRENHLEIFYERATAGSSREELYHIYARIYDAVNRQ